jgi:hypothetical protein
VPHDQSRAENMLTRGLAALGIRSQDLASLPKGQTEKQVLAWWLYSRTTVRRRWVATSAIRVGSQYRAIPALPTSPRLWTVAVARKLQYPDVIYGIMNRGDRDDFAATTQHDDAGLDCGRPAYDH